MRRVVASVLVLAATQLICPAHLPGSPVATDGGRVAHPPQAMRPGWSTGLKRVLAIRIGYADHRDETVTAPQVSRVMADVGRFFADSSYGQTSLTTEVTPLYILPQTAQFYAAATSNVWDNDTMSAAGTQYDVKSYDRLLIISNTDMRTLPGTTRGSAGLGAVEGERLWINAPAGLTAATLVHEMGHTFGLLHANLWLVSDGNPVSAHGTSSEYGDPFDVMGTSAAGDFNLAEKAELQWLPTSSITNVIETGTYRIYRFDHPATRLTRPLGLHVLRDGSHWYWVALRGGSGNASLDNGAYIVLAQTGEATTQLIDTATPGRDPSDAGLGVGQTLNDLTAGITIRPVARGGLGADQYLDVEVTIAPRTGVVTAWGAMFAASADVPAGLHDVSALAAGYDHVVALKTDGTIVSWGRPAEYGTPISPPAGLTDVVGVAAYYQTSGAVKRDGSVVMWGENRWGNRSVPVNLTGVVQLAIGDGIALARKSDGTVVGWGQFAPPDVAQWRDIAFIAAGSYWGIGIKADGTAIFHGDFSGWSAGSYIPMPSNLTDLVSASIGNGSVLALRRDGTVVGWGDNRLGQASPPPNLKGVRAVVAVAGVSFAVKSDGTIVTWGADINRLDRPPLGLAGVQQIAVGACGLALVSPGVVQIAVAPTAATVNVGQAVTLTATVLGAGAQTLQWQRQRRGTTGWEPLVDNAAIAGATTAQLTLVRVGTAMDGDAFRLTVGSVSSDPITLHVNYSRLVNISTRAYVPAGEALIAGYVVGTGDPRKPLILRAVGPTLGDLGVAGALPNPRLTLVRSGDSAVLTENDDWSGTATLRDAFTAVGAFALRVGSGDAAVQTDVDCDRGYSVRLTSADATGNGTALVEVYDASDGNARSRLLNISTLGRVAAGDQSLIAGFTIRGTVAKTLLLRAVGPGLAVYGVATPLGNPQLALIPLGQVTLATNDDWPVTAVMRAAFAAAGAFPLADGSRDAALLITVPPGGYTVMVNGVAATTGNALVEVYDLDP